MEVSINKGDVIMAKKNGKQEDYIFLYSKKVKIPKLVESFVVIPSYEIVKYLRNKEIFLPYYVHKALIRKNIAPAIATAESANKFSDEMKFRLKWFDKFTIFQLERLAEGYQLSINVEEYKKDFWDIVVRNRTDLGINNLEFVKLQNLSMKYSKEPQEDYEILRTNFEEIYFEPTGYLVVISVHGSGVNCLIPRDILRSSRSMVSTTASILAPTSRKSDGLRKCCDHDISDTWISPSTPGSNSTKAP